MSARSTSDPVQRIETRDAEVFQPSSFASRAAERAARGELRPRPPAGDPRGRRLVSLGKTPVRLPGHGRDKPNRVVDVELFFDADRRVDYFVRQEGGGMEPLMRQTGENQTVEALGSFRAKPRNWMPTAGAAKADECVILD